jgi:hypothetical protein
MSTADLNTPMAQRIAASLARQGMMTHLNAKLLRVVVTTVEVFHIDAKGKKSMCAVMQQTLVPVPQTY